MNSPAHVSSIDAIRAFRLALKQYEQAMRDSMECLRVEIQRAVDWVSEDRTCYWPAQRKKSEERVTSARTDLELCKMASFKDEKRSCYQEKKNLERAMARQRHCEQQEKNTRHWRHVVDHQAEESGGKMARLAHYLDTDIPKALAALDRIIAALEKYAETSRSSGDSAV